MYGLFYGANIRLPDAAGGEVPLLNLFHWAATVFIEAFDLSQVCLLSFVPVVNVLLIVTLWKSLKQEVK